MDIGLTDPATIAAGNFLRDSIHANGYATVSNETANEFATGILASTVASTGALVGITNAARFDFGVAPLPTGPGGCPAARRAGRGWRSPPSSPTSGTQRAQVHRIHHRARRAPPYFSQRTGYLAVRKSVAGDPSQQQYLADNPRARVAVDQLPHTRSQDYARVFLPGADRIISAGLESIGLKGSDVRTTFTDINQQLQVVLDRQIKRKLPGLNHG